MSEKTKKIFFDLDGTLNVFEKVSFEEVCRPGYMKYRRPHVQMVECARLLQNAGYDVWIASAVLPYEYSVPDKNYWVDKYLPFIPMTKRLYIPYGENKAWHIHEIANEGDVFVDDFTKNLNELSSVPGLVNVKCVNGINDTNKSWKGRRVYAWDSAESIMSDLLSAPIQPPRTETKIAQINMRK